jgi:hypothetical protein
LDTGFDLVQRRSSNRTSGHAPLVRDDGKDVTRAVQAGECLARPGKPYELTRIREILVLGRPNIQSAVAVEEGGGPGPTVDDRDELLRSARKLSQLDFDALLLCDGEPVMSGGKERLAEFVSAAGLG